MGRLAGTAGHVGRAVPQRPPLEGAGRGHVGHRGGPVDVGRRLGQVGDVGGPHQRGVEPGEGGDGDGSWVRRCGRGERDDGHRGQHRRRHHQRRQQSALWPSAGVPGGRLRSRWIRVQWTWTCLPSSVRPMPYSLERCSGAAVAPWLWTWVRSDSKSTCEEGVTDSDRGAWDPRHVERSGITRHSRGTVRR